jgi:hypothetical protein
MTSIRKQASFIAALLFVLSLFWLGCGGGGGGGSAYFDGGIGGTGVSAGVITALGSVTVNGVRYGTDDAVFTVDDNSSAGLADLAVGMRVIVEYTTADDEAFSVFYEPELTGPVDAVNLSSNTITVLGQTVLVNTATEFVGVTGIDELNEGEDGDIVEVSGFFNAAGEIQAVYVELEDDTLDEFEIKGTVEIHDPVLKTFEINGLLVNYVDLLSPPSIENGDFVEVEGNLSGEGVFQADELEIEDSVISPQDDEEVEIEGLVTALDPAPDVDFEVNGFPVQLTDSTEFENGTAGDIDLDVRLEVEGHVESGILIAEQVEFESP